MKLLVSTGLLEAGAPKPRIATVYWPGMTAAGQVRHVLGMSKLSEPVSTGCRGAPGAVIGTPDEKWGELVTTLIVASDPALTEEELITLPDTPGRI